MSATTTEDFPQMEYVRLGNTGMKVSRLCLGCMSYGSSKWAPWVKDEKESMELIEASYKLGINFFDTADVYSNGESEKVLGKALKKIGAPRSRVVVATKVMFPVHKDVGTFNNKVQDDPEYVNEFGLSRKHILDAVDASLKRLDTGYIDLYIIHRFDPNTPIEETMEALNDVVRSGKVRYIGASSMSTWQFQKMNFVAEKNGWAKFVSMQNLYNLVYREEEREMIPYCLDSSIGMTPWSPLSGGELAGKNRNTARQTSRFAMKNVHPTTQHESNEIILDRVGELAKKYSATYAQIAMAWQFTKPYVTSPIIGLSKMEQLHDLVRSLSIKLTEEDAKYLEEPYAPRNVI
ncbi:aryl-alcohol dehydrogenase (NADP+) [Mucor circinelloides 1006PhL]|uniref:Aryl-alcohol dehydrogenase (NADP+) n=1 Tax=Mucor circinelloides f. circinelloides (strain 1006PhL) TaxID=1220926 RepID=S2JND8_MUCC1|nr:aryl-alcohol dehydrogenase (NADP+) [Mucor circinelloides 1006PhL]